MTGFDIFVVVVVGVAAVGGFMRGFVQEVLSLASWFLAIFAIRFLHDEISVDLTMRLGSETNGSLLAFVILLMFPLILGTMLARRLGAASRNSALGPVDRVLGFGFGALKGMLVVVIAFSMLVLAYDTVWGAKGRPLWIAEARTYQFVDAASRALVTLIDQRRAAVLAELQA